MNTPDPTEPLRPADPADPAALPPTDPAAPRALSPTADRRRAILLCALCTVAYLGSYVSRNLLSLCAPEMEATGLYALAFLGYLSSVYLFAYAGGQLVNGALGDLLDPILLASLGLALSGGACLLFPHIPARAGQIAAFAVLGYGLSMVRGPMMKVISENVHADRARLISVFLTVTSYVGPWLTSSLAILLGWRWTFTVSGVFSVTMSLAYGSVLQTLRRRGRLTVISRRGDGFRGFLRVFRLPNFFPYFFVGGVVQTAISSFGFWFTSYLVKDLGYSESSAKLLYSVVFLLPAAVPFLTLFLFRLTRRPFLLTRSAFLLATLCFLLMNAPLPPAAKVVCFALAQIFIACPSAVLWSVYLPGLGESGRVSSVNGIMDCGGYLFAALSNMFLSALTDSVLPAASHPWRIVIFLWAGISSLGLLASLFGRDLLFSREK